MTYATFISLNKNENSKNHISISFITGNPWNQYFIITLEYDKKDSFYTMYKKLKNINIIVKNKNDFQIKFEQFKRKYCLL